MLPAFMELDVGSLRSRQCLNFWPLLIIGVGSVPPRWTV